MHFSRAVLPVLVLSRILSACATTNKGESGVKTVRETQTTMTDSAPLLQFIASAKAVQESPTQSGTIPTRQFIALMPLSTADNQALNAAYPGTFTVTCDAGLCSARASGAETVATLLASVKVSFFVTISNPTLTVADEIVTDFVLRSDEAVEFCNVAGMTVSKLGVVQTIHGLFDRLEDGVPRLAVGDADGDFTCN